MYFQIYLISLPNKHARVAAPGGCPHLADRRRHGAGVLRGAGGDVERVERWLRRGKRGGRRTLEYHRKTIGKP